MTSCGKRDFADYIVLIISIYDQPMALRILNIERAACMTAANGSVVEKDGYASRVKKRRVLRPAALASYMAISARFNNSSTVS